MTEVQNSLKTTGLGFLLAIASLSNIDVSMIH